MTTTTTVTQAVPPVKRNAVYQRPACESFDTRQLRFYAKAAQEGLTADLAHVTESGSIWDVTSSQAGHAPYTVTVDWGGEGTCSCEAAGYCKHIALARGVDWKGYDPICPVCHLGECWTFCSPVTGAWRCRRCGATADFTRDEAATIVAIRTQADYQGIPAEPILLISWMRTQAPPPPAPDDLLGRAAEAYAHLFGGR